MRFSRSDIPIILLLVVVLTAAGCAALNFSGTWKLDAKNSESMLPNRQGPTNMILTVIHKGDQLSIERSLTWQGQDHTRTLKLKTDGSETVNQGWSGNDVVYMAKVVDDKLIVNYEESFNSGSMEVQELHRKVKCYVPSHQEQPRSRSGLLSAHLFQFKPHPSQPTSALASLIAGPSQTTSNHT